jgi:hypothetical protein
VSWLRIVGGIILVLLGLLWIAQGINVLPGSAMSGQAVWAVIGVVVALVGAWLLWTAAGQRRSRAARM